LQDGWVALSTMGRAQDRLGEDLDVTGMDRLWKRRHRGIKRRFHHRDYLGRKGRIGKILHSGCNRKQRLPTRLGSGNAIGSRLKFDVSYPLDTDCIIFPKQNRSLETNKIAVMTPMLNTGSPGLALRRRLQGGSASFRRGRLQGWILVKITVVKLRQLGKLRLIEHHGASAADIHDPLLAQLPDDAICMHRRDP